MDCLNNIIGIHRKCTEVVPSSGLYLQDLPGMSLSVANAGTDSETISGIKMIEEKIEFVQSQISSMIRNQMEAKFKVKTIIQNDTLGYYRDNLRVVNALSGYYGGIKIIIDQYPYLDFFIHKIYLKLSQAITTDVYIMDLMNGTILDTLPITTVSDTPTAIIVNKSYPTLKQKLQLGIFINSGISNTYETGLTSVNDCYSCGNNGYTNKYIQVTGAKLLTTDQKINSNVRANTGTNGLSIDYSVNCSIEPFICNMGNKIAMPLLYKVGAEVLKEVKYSRKQNSIVNIDDAMNTELITAWENEFMSLMGAILNNLDIPNDICFSCNWRVRKAVAIP